MNKIIEKCNQLSEIPSDINEHLFTLKKYAEECETIVEMGVRHIVSTWAFLSGNPKKLTSLDLYNPKNFGGDLQEVYDAVELTDIKFSFVEHDSLTYEMEPCDLLFIDTWHDYLQLKKELLRHHSNVNKYIILHDTSAFGFRDEGQYDDYQLNVLNMSREETNLPKGLWPAVEEFLYDNRDWVIWEKKPNNNGLTILKRINELPKEIKEEVKEEKKKVALISTFCDTQEKIDSLEKNIKIVKNYNIDVIIISPFTLPDYINKLCDYVFITKDNPILEWPNKCQYFWVESTVNDSIHRMATTVSDYGYAGINQIKQLSDIALSMNYNQFYHMIYDIKIDDNIIEGFNSDKDCSVYPSKRNDTVWPVGLHYMIFNRPNLMKFISNMTLSNYLSVGGDAFAWLHSIQDKVNYVIEDIPVEDEIYYYDNRDFFNMSPIDGLKFFIEKNDDTKSNIRLYFHGNDCQKEIEIKIGENKNRYVINNYDIIDLGINNENYQQVVITMDSLEYDITDIIVKIKHTVLSINKN